MSKKYELTDEMLNFRGWKVYRIRALRDFSDVKAGDLGGFVDKDGNLSHEGDCWIYDNAMAYNETKITGNARLYGYANVGSFCEISGNAVVRDYATVWICSKVKDNAVVRDFASVCEGSIVKGNEVVAQNHCVEWNGRSKDKENIESHFFEIAICYGMLEWQDWMRQEWDFGRMYDFLSSK